MTATEQQPPSPPILRGCLLVLGVMGLTGFWCTIGPLMVSDFLVMANGG